MSPYGSVPRNDSEKAKKERPTQNPNDGGDENDGDREKKRAKTVAEGEHAGVPTDQEILMSLSRYLHRKNMKYPSRANYPRLIAFAHEWRPELHPDRIIGRIMALHESYLDYMEGLAGVPGSEGPQNDAYSRSLMKRLCRDIWGPDEEPQDELAERASTHRGFR